MRLDVSLNDLFYLAHNHGFIVHITSSNDGVMYVFQDYDMHVFKYSTLLVDHDLNKVYTYANKEMLRLKK